MGHVHQRQDTGVGRGYEGVEREEKVGKGIMNSIFTLGTASNMNLNKNNIIIVEKPNYIPLGFEELPL